MSARLRVRLVFVALSALTGAGCASSAPRDGNDDVTAIRHVDKASSASAKGALAGARCRGRQQSCVCRSSADAAESEPPSEGMKRFEIRLAADGGTARIESPLLGAFQVSGPLEHCFYVDVPAPTTTEVAFSATADSVRHGVAPRIALAEYGPKGPFWYDVIQVDCRGTQGRCTRDGVDAWAARNISQRKRGRLDPCGSAVVTQLRWDTTGGQADRDGGFFRDLTVRFAFEVKKFATQFAPGSTECVPK